MNTQAPVEDIHAIVGRFQAWAGAQTAKSSRDEVRELTYEEAIKASRHRSSSGNAAAQPIAASPVVVPIKEKEPVRPEKKPAARRRKQKSAARTRHRSAHPAVAAEEKPVFRQVLSESILGLSAAVRPSAEMARPASLSIRVSMQEQALIRARAAEANLSVSAYLRQCALEVEQLRFQLQQALTARPQAFLPPSAPMPSAPGLLTRLGQWLFPRKTAAFTARA